MIPAEIYPMCDIDKLAQINQRIVADRITQRAASAFGKKPTQLRQVNRSESVRIPRQIAQWMMVMIAGLSVEYAGTYFGLKRSGVYNSLKVVNYLRDGRPDIRRIIEQIEEEL